MKNIAKKNKIGRVISNKMKKTVVVAVEGVWSHKKYQKQRKRIRKYKAHDEKAQCGINDIVKIEECRPMSADKKWVVRSVIKKAEKTEGIELKDEIAVRELTRKKEKAEQAAAVEGDNK